MSKEKILINHYLLTHTVALIAPLHYVSTDSQEVDKIISCVNKNLKRRISKLQFRLKYQ